MDLYHKKRSKICRFLPVFTAVFTSLQLFEQKNIAQGLSDV